MQELWIDRSDYRKTKIVDMTTPDIADGEILVEVEKYGLTANNVTYAVVGDMIGYWKFFPAQDNWGKVPVWAMANVVASKAEGIEAGERLYGYFPMATHLVMQPGRVKDKSFSDMAEHRQSLPPVYNNYNRTKAEPEFMAALENERCLYFPLFVTSFLIADYLMDNDFFDAEQIMIGSVSSKTGFGTAEFLKTVTGFKGDVIGLTSPGNKAFVERLNCCDQVLVYGEEGMIDTSKKSVYVDMSGNGPLRETLHNALNDNMVRSVGVGATHWEEDRTTTPLPGAKPEMFFAPSQILKRNQEWGPGAVFERAYSASAVLAGKIKDDIAVEWKHGAEDARDIWIDMLDNKVSPKRGIMVSFKA